MAKAICQRASGWLTPTRNVGKRSARTSRPPLCSAGCVTRPQRSTCRRFGPRYRVSSCGLRFQRTMTVSPGRAKTALALPPGSSTAPTYLAPPSSSAVVRQGKSNSPGLPSGSISPHWGSKGSGQKIASAPWIFAANMRRTRSSARSFRVWPCLGSGGITTQRAARALRVAASRSASSSAPNGGWPARVRNRHGGLAAAGNGARQSQPRPTCTSWPMRSRAAFTAAILAARPAVPTKLASSSPPSCHQRTCVASRIIVGSSDGYQSFTGGANNSAAAGADVPAAFPLPPSALPLAPSSPTNSIPSVSIASRKATARVSESLPLSAPHQRGYFTQRMPAWESSSTNCDWAKGCRLRGRVQPNSLATGARRGETTARLNWSRGAAGAPARPARTR